MKKEVAIERNKNFGFPLFFPSLSSNFLLLSLNAASGLLSPEFKATTIDGSRQGRKTDKGK
jgi:hypothetical protein